MSVEACLWCRRAERCSRFPEEGSCELWGGTVRRTFHIFERNILCAKHCNGIGLILSVVLDRFLLYGRLSTYRRTKQNKDSSTVDCTQEPPTHLFFYTFLLSICDRRRVRCSRAKAYYPCCHRALLWKRDSFVDSPQFVISRVKTNETENLLKKVFFWTLLLRALEAASGYE